MNEKQFIEEIAEIIETDASELTMESYFRESADVWSSLTGFSILIFMQDRCGVNIPVDDFLNMNTVADLYSTTVKEG